MKLLIIIILLCCSIFAANIYWYERYTNSLDDNYTIPGLFYNDLQLPPQMYMYEVSDEQLSRTIQKHVYTTQEIVGGSTMDILNTYLLHILNSDISSNDRQFRTIDSKIINIIDDVITSEHIVHRDTKMYGFHIKIVTTITDNTVQLKRFNIEGIVFEDKIYSLQPYNLTQTNFFKKDDQVFGDYLKEYRII